MQRLITICALFCALFITSCGGSSGKGILVPSTDFLGAEAGFRQKFSITSTEEGITSTGYSAREVCFAYNSDPSIPLTSDYKFFLFSDVSWEEGGTPESIGEGGFIELRTGNSYYNAGHWNKTACGAGYESEWCYEPKYRDILPDSNEIDMVAPIVAGQKLGGEEIWLRQENITIAAGTYNAWYSEYSEDRASDSIPYTATSKRWFVPNIGLIKFVNQKVRKDTGEMTYIFDQEMTSTSIQPLNQYGVSSGCATLEIPLD